MALAAELLVFLLLLILYKQLRKQYETEGKKNVCLFSSFIEFLIGFRIYKKKSRETSGIEHHSKYGKKTVFLPLSSWLHHPWAVSTETGMICLLSCLRLQASLKEILSSSNVQIKLLENSFKLNVWICWRTRDKCSFSKGLFSTECSGTSSSLELIECCIQAKCDTASRCNTIYSSICPHVSS